GTSQELVQVPNTNEYRLRVDDGSFLRFFLNSTPTKPSAANDGWTRVRNYLSKLGRSNPRLEAGTGWTIYDKSGIGSYYGSTPASRLANPNNADQHAKWYLDRTQDPNGNYFTVTYTTFPGSPQLYPSHVDYTGNSISSLSPTNSVTFNYETTDRSTVDANASYAFGFELRTTRRLSSIEARAGGSLAAKYVLQYSPSASTGRSLLTAVQRYGTDGWSALPATTFEYSSRDDDTFTENVLPTGGYDLNPDGGFHFFPGDFNGDGRCDFIHMIKIGSDRYARVWLSNGSDPTTQAVTFDIKDPFTPWAGYWVDSPNGY